MNTTIPAHIATILEGTPTEQTSRKQMALNSALRQMIADAKARYEPRETLLNLIANTLERIHAMPDESLDYQLEALGLLEQVEAWAVARHPDGYLVLRDPADEITCEDAK